MPVIWMTPLFWLKVVTGKVLNTAAISELTPSPNTPPLIRFSYSGPLMGSPEIIEVAVKSPEVSILVIIYIKAIGINACHSKPKPNLKGTGRVKIGASATNEKSIRPINIAAIKPSINPIKMALERITLLSIILINTTLTSTPPPSNRFCILPKFSAPTPPAKSVRPTLVNESPMVTITQPVTIGLIKDLSLVINWLKKISTNAPRNETPKITERISSGLPPLFFTTKPAANTAAKNPKLVPCSAINPEPTGPTLWVWIKVATPDTIKDILMR